MSVENGGVEVHSGGSATLMDDSFAEAFFANEIPRNGEPARVPTVVEDDIVDEEPAPDPVKPRDEAGKFKSNTKAEKPAPKVEEPEESEEADDSPIAGWDDSIVADAKSRNFTDEYIAGFGSESALRRALMLIDKRELEEFRAGKKLAADGGKPTEKSEAKPDDKAATTETKSEQQQSTDDLLQKLDIGLSEDFDEDVVAAFSKINDHFHGRFESLHKQNTALQQQLTALVQFQNEYQNDRLNQFADRFFASADEVYADEIGKGTLAEVSPEAQEVRRQIVAEALDRFQLAQDTGRGPKDLQQALDQAMKVRFFDKHQQLARKDVAKKVSQRKASSVQRPTQRRASAGTPDQAAANFAERWYKEHGLDEQSTEDQLAVLGK
jgi:hypothetical protein